MPIALVVFLAATTGAEVIARVSIGGEPFAIALQDHLHWAGVQFAFTLILLAPFVTVAFLCARLEKKARNRGIAVTFVASLLTLFYFYFRGQQGAQYALLEERGTAATLSVGLPPFVIGIPVILAVIGAGALAAKFDRRVSAMGR